MAIAATAATVLESSTDDAGDQCPLDTLMSGACAHAEKQKRKLTASVCVSSGHIRDGKAIGRWSSSQISCSRGGYKYTRQAKGHCGSHSWSVHYWSACVWWVAGTTAVKRTIIITISIITAISISTTAPLWLSIDSSHCWSTSSTLVLVHWQILSDAKWRQVEWGRYSPALITCTDGGGQTSTSHFIRLLLLTSLRPT